VHAGHGLHYHNVQPVSRIPQIACGDFRHRDGCRSARSDRTCLRAIR
jgi:hypothetical protein